MGAIVEAALYRGISGFLLLFVLLSAGLILLGYLIYIVVMTVRKLKK